MGYMEQKMDEQIEGAQHQQMEAEKEIADRIITAYKGRLKKALMEECKNSADFNFEVYMEIDLLIDKTE